MQDLIASGAAWFDQQRKKHLSVMVEYKPATAMFSRMVAATIGGSRFEMIDANNQIVRFESRDFFISAEDYPDKPQRGDRIFETINGERRCYQVTAPGGMQNAWSWADRGQRVRRIHTSLIESD